MSFDDKIKRKVGTKDLITPKEVVFIGNERPILQTGLFCRSDQECFDMSKRVEKFNLRNLTTPVRIDIIPYENGDRICSDPHYKFRFLFPSKSIQRRFWTGDY